ncbi:MAG: prepilin-type N-terminal cleavage/methylation domain-containing protein [Hydrogenibacillus sp.]|nr:prepilin-type N-terminal cleavage/methylation domain-containing protein [Hydrogenibacillus sp.]
MADGGFTLIELLIVIGLIALILGLVTPRILAGKERAEEKLCKSKAEMINQAIVEYVMDHGESPGSDVGSVIRALADDDHQTGITYIRREDLGIDEQNRCAGKSFDLDTQGRVPKLTWPKRP